MRGLKIQGECENLIGRITSIKVIIILACALIISSASAAGNQWKIEFISGDVSYRLPGGGQWKKCRLGGLLDGSAMVRTGKKSTLVLEMGAKKITISPESTVTLQAYLSAKDAGKLLDLSGAASRILHGILHEKGARVTEILGVRGDDAGADPQLPWSDDLESPAGGDPVLDSAMKDYEAGKYEEVIAALGAGNESAGTDDRACLLGMSYFNLGYYRESIEGLDRAASSRSIEQGMRTKCRFLGALSRVFLGEFESSIADLEALAEMNPAGEMAPGACFVLAGIYRVRGDAAAARRWYEALVSRYPSNDLAPEARKKLADMK